MIKYILSLCFFSFLTSQNYPDYELNILSSPFPNNLFLYTMSEENRFMSIFDSQLNLKWHVHSNNMGLDFKVNQDYLSYFHRTDMTWILINQSMHEVDTLIFEGPYNADYHDIQILSNGNYILQAYDSRFIDMSLLVSNGQPVAWITGILVLQEFNPDDELIFEWDAWEHLDITDYDNLDLTMSTINWMHANSIEIANDQNFLISNRVSSEVIKINRESGEVLWHLGGPLNEFTVINDSKNGFSMQHDVRILENGNVTLFDNGVNHNPPISRAVEFELDESMKTVNLIWEYTHPDSVLGLAMGSVQRLPNGNTLINWGTMSNRGALITEVTYDHNTTFEIQFPDEHKVYKVRKSNWMFSVNLENGDTDLNGVVDVFDINSIIDHTYNEDIKEGLYHKYRFDTDKNGEINFDDAHYIVDLLVNN